MQQLDPYSPGPAAVRVLVHVVDDDPLVRDAVSSSLVRAGLDVQAHTDAEQFLARFDPEYPQVLVLDISLPGMSGLDLLDQLFRSSELPPTVVLSASDDVSHVVDAMRGGAVDYLEKPPDPERLHAAVRQLVGRAGDAARERMCLRDLAEAFDRLTAREREVFHLLAGGASTKQIAHSMGISLRTAHVHRTHVLTKFDTESLAELARYAGRLAEAEKRRLAPS